MIRRLVKLALGVVDVTPVEEDLRRHERFVATVDRLHGQRADGTCTCDPRGERRWAECPTAIAVTQHWFGSDA